MQTIFSLKLALLEKAETGLNMHLYEGLFNQTAIYVQTIQ